MKTGNIFWGVLLIFTGIFFLLFNFEILNIEITALLKYWPIILITGGLSMLKLSKPLKVALSGFTAVFIALVIIAFFSSLSNKYDNISSKIKNSANIKINSNQKLNSDSTVSYSVVNSSNNEINYAELNLEIGGCFIEIKDTTDDIINISMNKAFAEFENHLKNDKLIVDFETLESEIKIDNDNYDEEKLSNYGHVKLNTEKVWDFKIEAGLSKLDMDLSSYKVRNLSFESGLADVDVRLGNKYDLTTLDIESGLSSIYVSIPFTSGAKIVTKGFNMSNFDGFTKRNDNEFYTANFDTASKKIVIYLDGGLSGFNVEIEENQE